MTKKRKNFYVIFKNYVTVGCTHNLLENFNWENTKVIDVENNCYRIAWPHATHEIFDLKTKWHI